MMRRNPLLLLFGVATAFVAALPLAAQDAAPPAAEGQKWAVIVGVTEYSKPGIPKLRYCDRGARGIVTIAASEINKEAFEFGEPISGGVFTYYLSRALAGAAVPPRTPVSFEALRQYVVTNVNKECLEKKRIPQNPVFLLPPE